jgi:hypothetical protein
MCAWRCVSSAVVTRSNSCSLLTFTADLLSVIINDSPPLYPDEFLYNVIAKMFRVVICHYQGDYSYGTVTVPGDFTVMPYRCSKWDILQLLVILKAVQSSTVQYCTVLYLLYFTVQCSTVLYNNVLYLLYFSVQCSTVLYSNYCTYCTLLYSAVQYCPVMY